MIAHKLMMNQEKTIIIQLTRQNDDIFTETFSISGANIPVTPVAPNLGVLWDSRLSVKAHVNQTCRTSYMHISNISAFRRMLTKDAAETLVHAFVSSRLDYCNSLLYGLPASTLKKLQLIQNHAARVVTGAWKYDRITPVLRKLHWLPMSYVPAHHFQIARSRSPTRPCTGRPLCTCVSLLSAIGLDALSALQTTLLAWLRHRLAASTGIAVLPSPVPPCGMIYFAV